MKFIQLFRNGCLLMACMMFVRAANSQGQRQICDFQGGCWRCVNSMGFACGAQTQQRCPHSCTNTSCSSGEVLTGKCKTSEDKVAALRNPKLIRARLSTGSTQQGTSSAGTRLTFWPGSTTDPVLIVATTHDSDNDLLAESTLKNQNPSGDLVAYRMGWIVFSRNSAPPEVMRGSLTKTQVKPTDAVTVGSQGASPTMLQSNPQLIVFFVAEAQFSKGKKWTASIPEIESKYLSQLE